MIKNYHILKQHCAITYSIGNKELTVGELSNEQLDRAYILLNRLEQHNSLNLLQKRQLAAIKYVTDYRKNSLTRKSVDRAWNTANVIYDWIKKSYK